MKFRGSHVIMAQLCVLILSKSTPSLPCKSLNPLPWSTKFFSIPTELPLFAQCSSQWWEKGTNLSQPTHIWRHFCSFFSPKQPPCHQLGLSVWNNGQAVLMSPRLQILVISSNTENNRLFSRRISIAHKRTYLNHQVDIWFLNCVYEPE